MKPESRRLIDNSRFYLTIEGKLFVKTTDYFKERPLGHLEPDDLSRYVEQEGERFQKIEATLDELLAELKKRAVPIELDQKLENHAAELAGGEPLKSVDAVGDLLDELLGEVRGETSGEAAAGSSEGEQDDLSGTDAPEVSGQVQADQPDEPKKKEDGPADGTDKQEVNAEEPEEPDADTYFRELAEKAEDLIKQTDWPYVTMELANIEVLWEEGPDPSASDIDISVYRNRIDKAREEFEKKKEAHYEEQRRQKEANLEKRKALLKQLKEIIDAENWTATRDVNRIRNQWDQHKPLPSGKEEELSETFQKWLKEFESHKIDRIVRKKEKEEENLVGKLLILDKMDVLLKQLEDPDTNWEKGEKELNRLNRQWHKTGRVPSEKNKETWSRYHAIQDRFHELRFKYDAAYRQQIENFLTKKKQLIKEAEALIDDDDLAAAARNVNKLHRRWKKVGNLPQKEENELWDKFKAATDAFNDFKAKHIEDLREQEQQNLDERERLIEQAEALKDSEEWDKTHDAFQKLMKQWKASGPVPKRMSGKVWKRFKNPMDHFYDRRRSHFKEVRKKRKDNLDEKKETLEQLRALIDHEDPIQAVEKAKPLQEQFKKAGYVPIKFKNAIWKEYREVCDQIYDRFRAAKSATDVVGRENVSDYSVDDIAAIQKKQKEARKLRKELQKLREEMIQQKESLSYFKPAGKSSPLLDQVHERIQKGEEDIQKKEEKLDELEQEIDELKEES